MFVTTLLFKKRKKSLTNFGKQNLPKQKQNIMFKLYIVVLALNWITVILLEQLENVAICLTGYASIHPAMHTNANTTRN